MTVAIDAGTASGTPVMVAQDTVLVLDFGSQYSQLIARRVREARVYCELVPGTITAAEIQARAPRGLIFSGGPASVYGENAPRPDSRVAQKGKGRGAQQQSKPYPARRRALLRLAGPASTILKAIIIIWAAAAACPVCRELKKR